MTRPALTALLLASTFASAGCGISDRDATRPARAVIVTPIAHRPLTPRAPSASSASTLTAERTLLARFARTWISYTFATLAAQRRALAGLATGTLARQLHANAEADVQAGYVRVANVRSRGVAEAIVVRTHAPAIIVARERLTSNGQTQVSWQVYLATVTNTPAGQRLASWTPASSG